MPLHTFSFLAVTRTAWAREKPWGNLGNEHIPCRAGEIRTGNLTNRPKADYPEMSRGKAKNPRTP